MTSRCQRCPPTFSPRPRKGPTRGYRRPRAFGFAAGDRYQPAAIPQSLGTGTQGRRTGVPWGIHAAADCRPGPTYATTGIRTVYKTAPLIRPSRRPPKPRSTLNNGSVVVLCVRVMYYISDSIPKTPRVLTSMDGTLQQVTLVESATASAAGTRRGFASTRRSSRPTGTPSTPATWCEFEAAIAASVCSVIAT